MRNRIATKLMRYAPGAVLALLGLLVLVVVGLAAYLWTDDDRQGSLAALAVVATFALAIAAALAYRQNSRLVEAAIQEATETRNEAVASSAQAAASRDAVEEMRQQRELAYRPYLVIRRGSQEQHVDMGTRRVPLTPLELFFVRNIGSGPALNVRLAAHRFADRHEWFSEQTQGIGPGEEHSFPIQYGYEPRADGSHPDRYRSIVDEWTNPSGEVVVVRYEDLFGTYYRAGGPDRHHPDEWRGNPSTPDAPNWVRSEMSLR